MTHCETWNTVNTTGKEHIWKNDWNQSTHDMSNHDLFTSAKIFTKLALQRSSTIVRGLAWHENCKSIFRQMCTMCMTFWRFILTGEHGPLQNSVQKNGTIRFEQTIANQSFQNLVLAIGQDGPRNTCLAIEKCATNRTAQSQRMRQVRQINYNRTWALLFTSFFGKSFRLELQNLEEACATTERNRTQWSQKADITKESIGQLRTLPMDGASRLRQKSTIVATCVALRARPHEAANSVKIKGLLHAPPISTCSCRASLLTARKMPDRISPFNAKFTSAAVRAHGPYTS